MQKRDIIKMVLEGKKPPYVPWNCSFTLEAEKKLKDYLGNRGLEDFLDNHFLNLGSGVGYFEEIEKNQFKDVFGVIWDRSIDKDIGNVRNAILKKPDISNYQFPSPNDEMFFKDIPEKINLHPGRFRIFSIGFSLYERAWSLRGMENLMIDMVTNPDFVSKLLGSIADYNIEQVKKALKYDIDAVYFGDDWGMQKGLQMGYKLWKKFIYPELKRMYKTVKDEDKYIFIHSCGDVDELFEDLIEIGLNCFNPFQPEVMDVYKLLDTYRKRLSFHGGLSTQNILPYGTPDDVKKETERLIKAGKEGNYIFAPAHAVEGDVPLKNMLAFLDVIKNQ